MSDVLVPRVLLVVCDSWGVGDAPDAAAYGDAGADTLGNTSRAVGGLHVPNLEALGIGHLTAIEGVAPRADARIRARPGHRAVGRQGHDDRALGDDGDPARRAVPAVSRTGSRPRSSEPFEEAIGRGILGNVPASGTEIIAELGDEHLRTGKPIVYTSGDSVFQIATHKDVVPLPTLYEWSRVARRLLTGEHTVGRVIARPFEGPSGAFARSPERRDFAVPPPGPTVLDSLVAAGVPVYGVGKIRDIFSGQGITEGRYSDSNDHGVDLTLDYLERPSPAFVFTNLVDFDSKYGHRNDPAGYAKAIEAFDRRLPDLIGALDGGVLFITGDHGCDPDVGVDRPHP